MINTAASSNRLLDLLPRKDRERVVASCERVELAFAEKLFEPGGAIRHVHFPTAGYVLILTPVPHGGMLEIALIGSEGMVGIPLAMGVSVANHHAMVQGAGSALRMSAASFRRELGANAVLRATLGNYLFARFGQLARAAGCNRYHRVEERLARWLLMSADRARSDTFRITHEFLAKMLGVRRVGVTTAAGGLKAREVIRYRRGLLEILDRGALEKVACGCYQADLENYENVLARN